VKTYFRARRLGGSMAEACETPTVIITHHPATTSHRTRAVGWQCLVRHTDALSTQPTHSNQLERPHTRAPAADTRQPPPLITPGHSRPCPSLPPLHPSNWQQSHHPSSPCPGAARHLWLYIWLQKRGEPITGTGTNRKSVKKVCSVEGCDEWAE
jgi:hypothetical protein